MMLVGEKIRQARELECLTQNELADRIDVHPSAVAQMELGIYSATAEHIKAVAFATKFPPSFFEDTYHLEFPIGSLQFRARVSTMTKKDRAQAHRYGQTLLELFFRVRHLAGIKPTPVTIPDGPGENPRKSAELTRSALGLAPDTPITNLTSFVERGGVVVLALPVRLEGRDAFSAWVNDTPVIAISAELPGDRIRFSIAHELGHLVMHRASKGLIKELEQQANEFASELLVPYVPFLSVAAGSVSLAFFAEQKRLWGVSVQTLARRSRDMSLLTERQYHAVFEQLARLGVGRKQESDYLPIPREKPRMLRQLIERKYGIPIDLARLGRDVHMTPARLERILRVNAEGPKAAKTQTRVLPMRRLR